MKNKALYILFDMDDTLIDTKSVYDVVRRQAYDYLETCFGELRFSYSDFRQASILHRHTYKRQKLSSEAVASKSITNAALDFIGTELSETHKQRLHEISQTAFTMVPSLKDGVADALAKLTQTRRLYKRPIHLIVFTQGHQDWQLEKFNTLPENIRNRFEDIKVVSRKNEETYADFLKQNKLDADNVIMIGDKTNADITPALRVGMHAYHIPLRDHLDFPSPSLQKARNKTGKYQRFKNLDQCLMFIRHHFLQARPTVKLRHRF